MYRGLKVEKRQGVVEEELSEILDAVQNPVSVIPRGMENFVIYMSEE